MALPFPEYLSRSLQKPLIYRRDEPLDNLQGMSPAHRGVSSILVPIRPFSKPGIKLFDPNSNAWPSAAPPSKTSPSMRPTKSIFSTSPTFAARGLATQQLDDFHRRCDSSASSISSVSLSPYEAFQSSIRPNLAR